MDCRENLQLNEQIEELERKIEELMNTYYPNHILFSIPGLGKITVATIIAEIGDSVEKSPTQKNFIGYIGLYPVVYQSSQNKISFKMTWKENKWLKMAFILATVSARKITCVVYAILRSREPWNEKYALSSMKRAEQMSERNFPHTKEKAGHPNGVNPIRAQKLENHKGLTRQRKI